MKLAGKYTPPFGIDIEVREYSPAYFVMNEAYSNLSWSEPVIVVDLYEGDVLIKERVSVATLFDYVEDPAIPVLKAALMQVKENLQLDDMEIAE